MHEPGEEKASRNLSAKASYVVGGEGEKDSERKGQRTQPGAGTAKASKSKGTSPADAVGPLRACSRSNMGKTTTGITTTSKDPASCLRRPETGERCRVMLNMCSACTVRLRCRYREHKLYACSLLVRVTKTPLAGTLLSNMLQKFSQFFGDCHYDYELSGM